MANQAHLSGPALTRHVDGKGLGHESGAGLQSVVEPIGQWVSADLGPLGDDPVDVELHGDHLSPPGVETTPENQAPHSDSLVHGGRGWRSYHLALVKVAQTAMA